MSAASMLGSQSRAFWTYSCSALSVMVYLLMSDGCFEVHDAVPQPPCLWRGAADSVYSCVLDVVTTGFCELSADFSAHPGKPSNRNGRWRFGLDAREWRRIVGAKLAREWRCLASLSGDASEEEAQ